MIEILLQDLIYIHLLPSTSPPQQRWFACKQMNIDHILYTDLNRSYTALSKYALSFCLQTLRKEVATHQPVL